ncbi:MAG: ribosome biogenesis GTPase Der [Chloroflexi bacterium]|nr:ribosome biogenesis GTPase Der [Chloroflexota bacterium]
MTVTSTKPLVAIVGRPNVGKSTLFNRLVGERLAITSEVPGTTRDRIMSITSRTDRPFILVDTGGLQPMPESALWQKIKSQVEIAIDEADVIVFVVDSSQGITATDREIADGLRRTGKPIVLAANKADNLKREQAALEFYELGLGDPVPISAFHGIGIDDLVYQVVARFPPLTLGAEQEAVVKLAIVGRTNVGKSMLLNSILKEERAIVSEMPGTTRDSVDSRMEYDGQPMLLIDTAGIRRKGRIEPGIERFSVLRAFRAIDRADVILLVLDASELVTAQDTHVAGYVLDAYKGIVLTVNKWDLAQEFGLSNEAVLQEIGRRFKFLSYVPVCMVSALRREGIEDLLNTAVTVHSQWNREIPAQELSKVMMGAISQHLPPASGRRHMKIYRVKQIAKGPPTFAFYVNDPRLIHFSYQRYLENSLRKAFGFHGTHLKLLFKGRGEE